MYVYNIYIYVSIYIYMFFNLLIFIYIYIIFLSDPRWWFQAYVCCLHVQFDQYFSTGLKAPT